MTLSTLGSETTDRLRPLASSYSPVDSAEQRWSELARPFKRKSIGGNSGRRQRCSDRCGITAAGKTEAAFLPVLTQNRQVRQDPGLSVLYVSPLKALINDQFRRLDLLCERMEIPVVPWHGDAPQSAKCRLMSNPNGIALITPGSIEAMFVRHPANAQRLLSRLTSSSLTKSMPSCRVQADCIWASLFKRIDSCRRKRRGALAFRRPSAILVRPPPGFGQPTRRACRS